MEDASKTDFPALLSLHCPGLPGAQLRRVTPDTCQACYEVLTLSGRHLHITCCGESCRGGEKEPCHDHWDPPYPASVMQAHAREHGVYGVDWEGKTIGTLTVGTRCWTSYFSDDMWTPLPSPTAPVLYLGKLALLPAMQGRGLAKACLEAVTQLARELGCASIRLDAVTSVPNLHPLYTSCGWRVAPGLEAGRPGRVLSKHPHRDSSIVLTLYEKVLLPR